MNKKIIYIISIFLAFSSCIGYSVSNKNYAVDFNDPKSVAVAFIMALNNLDYDLADTYATDEGKESITVYRNLLNLVPEKERIKLIKNGYIFIQSTEIKNNRAIIKYTSIGLGDKINYEREIVLVYIENKWLISAEKNS